MIITKLEIFVKTHVVIKYYSHRKNNCQKILPKNIAKKYCQKILPTHSLITKRDFIFRDSYFCEKHVSDRDKRIEKIHSLGTRS